MNADVPKLIPGERVSDVDEFVNESELAVSEEAAPLGVAVTKSGAEGALAVALEVKVKVLFKIPGTAEPTLSVPVLLTPAGIPLTITVGVSEDELETVVYPVMP